jgi:hypothetical protein
MICATGLVWGGTSPSVSERPHAGLPVPTPYPRTRTAAGIPSARSRRGGAVRKEPGSRIYRRLPSATGGHPRARKTPPGSGQAVGARPALLRGESLRARTTRMPSFHRGATASLARPERAPPIDLDQTGGDPDRAVMRIAGIEPVLLRWARVRRARRCECQRSSNWDWLQFEGGAKAPISLGVRTGERLYAPPRPIRGSGGRV